MPTPNPYLEKMMEERTKTRPRSQQDALVQVRAAMAAIRTLQAGAWCGATPRPIHGFLKVAMTALLYVEEWCKEQHELEISSPTD